jgi:hypothetical protein
MEISVFPLTEGGDSVAFMTRRQTSLRDARCRKAPWSPCRNPRESGSPAPLLMDTAGAQSAALATPRRNRDLRSRRPSHGRNAPRI